MLFDLKLLDRGVDLTQTKREPLWRRAFHQQAEARNTGVDADFPVVEQISIALDVSRPLPWLTEPLPRGDISRWLVR